jgi:ATP/ADP translocase
MRILGNLAAHILDIRPREAGRLLLMSVYLLLVIACYTTTKAVRDSLFVTKIGPAQLPYMYLLIAGVMGLVSYAYARTVNRIGLYRLIRATSLIAISNLLLFWWLFRGDSPVWFYVLYVWVSLFGAITASQLWLLASHVFDAREARRVFPWIGVGGILGGMLGGGLTNVAAKWFGTESLLLVCSAMMGATIALLEGAARFVRLDTGVEQTKHNGSEAASNSAMFKQVRQSRHLTMLVVLLCVAVIVEAFVDYEYKFVAKQSFHSKDQLTAFFGSVTFYIGLSSLLFQTILANRILKRFGVGWAILLLPASLLVASVMVAVQPTLWTAALLQLVDGGFSYSIHRSGMELLFLPIPPQTRNAVKGFIDTFVDRTGRAVGGLLLLLLTIVLTLSISSISIVAGAFLILWIVTAVAVKREYLHSFRMALEKKAIEPEALQVPVLDNVTIASLLAALSSDDEREVVYALDLLSNTPPKRWSSYTQALIQHPSSAVRARTIAILAQWSDPAVTQDEFIHHKDYETARIAAASALSFQWTGARRSCRLLDRLLRDPSYEVVRQAIRTSGNVKYDDAVPVLIEKLAEKRLRSDVRDALLKFEGEAVRELVRRLLDTREPHAVRVRIPKVLAYTGRQDAADVMTSCLNKVETDLEYSVLKALNVMRARSSEIRIDSALIVSAINRERQAYDRLGASFNWLQRNPIGESQDGARDVAAVFSLLMKAIQERLGQKVERIFRFLALMYPPDDIYSAYYACKAKPALRASALEFLDNILDSGLKETVIPLIEESFDPGKASAREGVEFISTEAALEALIGGTDSWVKTIATDLAGRLLETAMDDSEGELVDGACGPVRFDTRR